MKDRRVQNTHSERPTTRARRALSALGVAVFWFLLWQVLSIAVGNELLLPSPISTLRRVAELAITADFWHSTALSLLRVTAGILSAVIAGIITAAACCRFNFIDRLISPFMTIIRSTPVASFIILALVWLGTSPLPAFIAFLMVYPLIFANVKAGIQSIDRELLRLLSVYELSPLTMLRRVYAPAAYPHFVTSLRSSLGLAWKAGIAAEVLAIPKYSIGRMLYQSKVYFETTDLFAWTFVIIILSLCIEFAVGRVVTAISQKRVKVKPQGGAATCAGNENTSKALTQSDQTTDQKVGDRDADRT